MDGSCPATTRGDSEPSSASSYTDRAQQVCRVFAATSKTGAQKPGRSSQRLYIERATAQLRGRQSTFLPRRGGDRLTEGRQMTGQVTTCISPQRLNPCDGRELSNRRARFVQSIREQAGDGTQKRASFQRSDETAKGRRRGHGWRRLAEDGQGPWGECEAAAKAADVAADECWRRIRRREARARTEGVGSTRMARGG